MENLINRLRYDNDDGSRDEAADALEQQAAVIEQMRKLLLEASCWIDVDNFERGRDLARRIDALQPCASTDAVLNKVRAEAVRKAIETWNGKHFYDTPISPWMEEFAQRIEKGEA